MGSLRIRTRCLKWGRGLSTNLELMASESLNASDPEAKSRTKSHARLSEIKHPVAEWVGVLL